MMRPAVQSQPELLAHLVHTRPVTEFPRDGKSDGRRPWCDHIRRSYSQCFRLREPTLTIAERHEQLRERAKQHQYQHQWANHD